MLKVRLVFKNGNTKVILVRHKKLFTVMARYYHHTCSIRVIDEV